MKTPHFRSRTILASRAFTLIELLVVISIIAVLMGVLFPVFGQVRESANKTRAKNDALQLVTAVRNYYSEYGRYPLPASAADADFPYGPGGTKNGDLLDELRGINSSSDSINPRGIRFLEVADAKSSSAPKGGIVPSGTSKGNWVDPWGTQYAIVIDGNYNNEINISSIYNDLGTTVQIAVGVASYGKDLKAGKAGNKTFKGSDDVISWQ
jgi:prepilin-type N-terminal cleavage/methylation domain-containing protein